MGPEVANQRPVEEVANLGAKAPHGIFISLNIASKEQWKTCNLPQFVVTPQKGTHPNRAGLTKKRMNTEGLAGIVRMLVFVPAVGLQSFQDSTDARNRSRRIQTGGFPQKEPRSVRGKGPSNPT